MKGLLRIDTVMAAAVQACARSFSVARVVWLATDSASQRKRKRVEEVFGWLKTVGGMRKKRFIGKARTQIAAYLSAAVYNMLRIAKLRRRECGMMRLPESSESPFTGPFDGHLIGIENPISEMRS